MVRLFKCMMFPGRITRLTERGCMYNRCKTILLSGDARYYTKGCPMGCHKFRDPTEAELREYLEVISKRNKKPGSLSIGVLKRKAEATLAEMMENEINIDGGLTPDGEEPD